MHARQSLAEYEHTSQARVLKQIGAAYRFEESEPQKQEHVWHQGEGVLGKLRGELVGRVRDDTLTIVRRPLPLQEIAGRLKGTGASRKLHRPRWRLNQKLGPMTRSRQPKTYRPRTHSRSMNSSQNGRARPRRRRDC